MFHFEDWLRQGIAGLLGFTLPKPGTPSLKRVEQLTMFRHFIATPPEPAVPDFAKRVATISIIDVDGNPKPDMTTDIPKGATEFQVDGLEDEQISIVLRDYDLRNNGSDPSDSFSFTVADTVAPPKPGQMHIARVEQIDDNGVIVPPAPAPVPPAPAPVPVPPVSPAPVPDTAPAG